MLQKQKIVPHLWFNKNAEEAANFYVSLFENSKILGITRYGSSDNKAGFAAGEVLTVTFQLEGQKFCAINGGTYFQLSEAMSFFVCCESQEEIDRLWEKLSEGGKIQECGWLKDRFGLSWQINWAGYEQLVAESAEKADRVLKALHGMKKVDIAGLQNA